MVLRYALIAGHYRQSLNLTEHGLQAAQSALHKLEKAVLKLLQRIGLTKEDFLQMIQANSRATTGIFASAWEALATDLNTPACLGELFTAIKQLDEPDYDPVAVTGQLEGLGSLLYALGITLFFDTDEAAAEAPEAIRALAEQRWEAKQKRDWQQADELRNTIEAEGWRILDSKEGYSIEKSEST